MGSFWLVLVYCSVCDVVCFLVLVVLVMVCLFVYWVIGLVGCVLGLVGLVVGCWSLLVFMVLFCDVLYVVLFCGFWCMCCICCVILGLLEKVFSFLVDWDGVWWSVFFVVFGLCIISIWIVGCCCLLVVVWILVFGVGIVGIWFCCNNLLFV